MSLPKNLTTVTSLSRFIALALFIALPCMGFILGMKYQSMVISATKKEPVSVDDFQQPQRVTLTGIFTCLPHRDTAGPQTMECAYGLQTEDTLYYALDFSLSSQTYPHFVSGEQVTLSGVMTPIEYLSTDYWQKYAIEGILSVTDSNR